jgi:hypothetical protein
MSVPAGLKTGRCHTCEEKHALIRYCGWCKHWFCGICRSDWPKRLTAALEELKTGAKPGCCGPDNA